MRKVALLLVVVVSIVAGCGSGAFSQSRDTGTATGRSMKGNMFYIPSDVTQVKTGNSIKRSP